MKPRLLLWHSLEDFWIASASLDVVTVNAVNAFSDKQSFHEWMPEVMIGSPMVPLDSKYFG